MFGTTLVAIGFLGMSIMGLHMFFKRTEKDSELDAVVKKTRLDTKKNDGIETYTYIVTFFIPEKKCYIHFSVSQEQFDVIMEKDHGVLKCNLKEKMFISWTAKL